MPGCEINKQPYRSDNSPWCLRWHTDYNTSCILITNCYTVKYIIIFIISGIFNQINISAQNMEKIIDKQVGSTYLENHRSELPVPVQKYFDLVLKQGNKHIMSVDLTHEGYFKTSEKSRWIKIKGKQFFRTDKPWFRWTGRTALFKAVDCFEDGSGKLIVKLLGIIPIVKEEGAHVDQAELLRWLGESFWFPSNFLPSENLSWDEVDSNTARVNYKYKDISISYLVSFNDKGEMTRLETERYRQEGEIIPWVGKVSDYRDFDGFLVPTHIEASWMLEEREYQYVDFYVETIEYQY